MVDEFMVCVDRLIQSTSTVSTTDGGGNGGGFEGRVGSGGEEMGGVEGNGGCCSMKSYRKKEDEGRECRICQEEGAESDMEAPCACNGTLKFAHRKCIQKWCNKKGDITCEICNQVYAPNYSVPHRRSTSDSLAIDIRQSWGQQLDFHDPRLLALASAEQVFLSAEFDDYSSAHSNGIACCRSVALILMLLLLIQHAFTVTRVSIAEDASAFFNVLWILSLFISSFLVSLLQLAGVLLPCYVIVRTCYLVQGRSQRQAYLRQAWG